MDLGLIKQPLGAVVMASATINDVIGWTLFALILSAVDPVGLAHRSPWLTVGCLAGLGILGYTLRRWVRHPIWGRLKASLPWPSGFVAVMAVLVLAAASFAETLGLHAVFGAFLVGVALAPNTEERRRHYDVVHQFVMSFFAPLYFVSIGLKTNFAASWDLGLVLVVFLIACLGKICGAGFGAWLGGMSPREALAIGFGMNARGAMEMILATVALESGLIDERMFVALVVMALATSLLSGPAMQRLVAPLRAAPPRAASVTCGA
jgi:Kef-type K+ transport system membrane component KefB